jgi:hypothetical protein
MSKVHISNSTIKFKKKAQNYPYVYQNFWNNIPDRYPLLNSPFVKENGGNLSRENYQHLVDHANERGLPVFNSHLEMMGYALSLMTKIQNLESGHEEELLDIAKDVISQEWNIDKDELSTEFMSEPGESGEEESHEGEEAPMTPKLEAEIGKRTLLNGLSQGAGLHSFLGIHYHPAAKERIENINPELLNLYNAFANVTSQSHFLMPPEMLEQYQNELPGAATGWSSANEEGDIEAKGATFSIICQELVKGLVAKYTNHQFDNESRQERGLEPLTDEERRTILNASDQLIYEPTQCQFGAEMWRKFLKASGENDKLDLISYISSGDVNESDNLMNQVTNNPELAGSLISEMAKEIEDTDFGYEEIEEALEEEVGDVPQEELGETPDDFASIYEELFGSPKKPDVSPEVDQGLPPVEFDDDDDYDKPFWMD